MFDAQESDGDHSNPLHVAEMIAYLGLPPLHFIKRSEHSHHVFDESGRY